jgi:hypothetical protein
MAATAMVNLNSRERDEFLKALEEARRAAMEDDGEPVTARKSASALGGMEFRHAIDRMAGKVRSYISASLLARLYSDGISRATAEEDVRASPQDEAAPAPPPAPKSEHDQVMDELHLTPNLTVTDLRLIRRRFAKANHPDRVAPSIREEATRRMTIANSLIDEALRGAKRRAM